MDGEQPAQGNPPAPKASARGHAPARVLVVDDHAGMRQQLAEFLRALVPGASVDSAGNAADALRALEQARYDLLLIDVHLPDGSGIQLGARLRARGCSAPIVFASIDGSPAQRAAVARVAGSQFVGKYELAESLPAVVHGVLAATNRADDGQGGER